MNFETNHHFKISITLALLLASSVFPTMASSQTSMDAYLKNVRNRIQESWKSFDRKGQVSAHVVFEICKNGDLKNVQVIRTTGNENTAETAKLAVKYATPFGPPPTLKPSINVAVVLGPDYLYPSHAATHSANRTNSVSAPLKSSVNRSQGFLALSAPSNSSPASIRVLREELAFKTIKLGITIDEFKSLSFSGLRPPEFGQEGVARVSTDEAGIGQKPWSPYPGLVRGKFYESRTAMYRGDPSMQTLSEASLSVSGVMCESDFEFIQDDSATYRLAEIDFKLKSREYSLVKAGLLGRYGKPSIEERDKVQNRMGAQYEDETLKWIFSNGEIELQRFFPDLDSSLLQYKYGPLIKQLRHIKRLDRDPSADL